MISKKIILIGDFATGKTSLIRRFVDNQFSDSYLSTIGVKISRKNIALEDEVVQGLIWDIEGGTEVKPVNRTYLMGAHGCIIVADITRTETMESIEKYIETVLSITPSAPIVIVLNKVDKISREQAEKMLSDTSETYRQKAKKVFLASAKSGEGVETMFHTLAHYMLG